MRLFCLCPPACCFHEMGRCEQHYDAIKVTKVFAAWAGVCRDRGSMLRRITRCWQGWSGFARKRNKIKMLKRKTVSGLTCTHRHMQNGSCRTLIFSLSRRAACCPSRSSVCISSRVPQDGLQILQIQSSCCVELIKTFGHSRELYLHSCVLLLRRPYCSVA